MEIKFSRNVASCTSTPQESCACEKSSLTCRKYPRSAFRSIIKRTSKHDSETNPSVYRPDEYVCIYELSFFPTKPEEHLAQAHLPYVHSLVCSDDRSCGGRLCGS